MQEGGGENAPAAKTEEMGEERSGTGERWPARETAWPSGAAAVFGLLATLVFTIAWLVAVLDDSVIIHTYMYLHTRCNFENIKIIKVVKMDYTVLRVCAQIHYRYYRYLDLVMFDTFSSLRTNTFLIARRLAFQRLKFIELSSNGISYIYHLSSFFSKVRTRSSRAPRTSANCSPISATTASFYLQLRAPHKEPARLEEW